jgi:hypothetical protein
VTNFHQVTIASQYLQTLPMGEAAGCLIVLLLLLLLLLAL